jgi:hypothetical protein
LYDLYDLAMAPLEADGARRHVKLTFPPGDGRIYLLADENRFAAAKKAIRSNQFKSYREMVKYDLYLLHLSGLASPSLVDEFRQAQSAEELKTLEQKIKLLAANTRPFSQVRESLAFIQVQLGDINTIIEDQITSLEAAMPRNIASPYVKREFNGADPLVKPYLDATLALGAGYFSLQNLFYQGKYQDIQKEVDALKELVTKIRSQMEKCFVTAKKPENIAVTPVTIEQLQERIGRLAGKYTQPYPAPDEMLRNNPR